jgi:hypothetical protein
MAEHFRHRHVEINDGERTVAAADVTTSQESDEPLERLCGPSPGTSHRAAA